MNLQGLTVARLATLIIVVLVVIVGGVVVIVEPSTLDFREYLGDVKVAVGLLAVGYGLDAASRP